MVNNNPLIRKYLKSIRFDDESMEAIELYTKKNECTFSTSTIDLVKLGITFWLQNQYNEED